jgi:DNA helicase-2/ATP-dependent DNA helicase PcrA
VFQPRQAQSEILTYQSGFLAISAVPGSGKTVTLAALAVELLARGLAEGSAVLVVTYMNSAVDNLSHRIGRQMEEAGIRQGRYEVRTLHGLAREIVLEQPGLAGVVPAFPVLDNRTSQGLLDRAVENWLAGHPDLWDVLLDADTADARHFWRQRIGEMAAAVVEVAKNRRWRPQGILERIAARPFGSGPFGASAQGEPYPDLLRMAVEIYGLYQSYVEASGGLDFDDLVWRAVDLLEAHPDFLERMRRRWPFILEDEAQDSVPLQEELLSLLAGPAGNWVRVGDPNQAITSTFTAAHPRFFRAFMERSDVRTIPMPETGRCAPRIMALANHLVEWVCHSHPLAEVRERAFRFQMMEPAPPGDPQPNPSDEPRNIAIHVQGYARRQEEELPRVAHLLERYIARFPDRTLAVLVPTNEVGYRMAEVLAARGLPYEELLESSTQARGVAGVLGALLAFAAAPLDRENLARAFEVLVDREWLPLSGAAGGGAVEGLTQERTRLARLLRSCRATERLLFPGEDENPLDALPAGRATIQDLAALGPLFDLVRRALAAASLPVDQFVLVLAADLFTKPVDLATAQQVAAFLRGLADADPSLRLPDLAEELARIAAGRRRFAGVAEDDTGFSPQAGRVTVTTQHRAKGLEWDFVCLVGIDRFWVPHDLGQAFLGSYEQLGGNPTATVQAQLRAAMGDPGAAPDTAEATRQANLETIAERLRLLYVGITRARRHLQISWSQAVEVYGRERRQEGTPVLEELAQFLRK